MKYPFFDAICLYALLYIAFHTTEICALLDYLIALR